MSQPISRSVSVQLKYALYTNREGLNNIGTTNIVESTSGIYYITTLDGMNEFDGLGIHKFFTTDAGIEFESLYATNDGIIANQLDENFLLVSHANAKQLISIGQEDILTGKNNLLQIDSANFFIFSNRLKNNLDKTWYRYYNTSEKKFSANFIIDKNVSFVQVFTDKLIAQSFKDGFVNYYLIKNNLIIDSIRLKAKERLIQQNYFCGDDGFLKKVSTKNDTLEIESLFKINIPIGTDFIRYFPDKNTVVYRKKNEIFKIVNGLTLKLIDLNSEINNVYIDLHDNLWMCTKNGLFNFYKSAVKSISFNGLSSVLNQVDYIRSDNNYFYNSSIKFGFFKFDKEFKSWERNKIADQYNIAINKGEIGNARQGFFRTKHGFTLYPVNNYLVFEKNNHFQMVKLSSDDDKIVLIKEDVKNELLYILTFKNIFVFNSRTLKLKRKIPCYVKEKTGFNSDLVFDKFDNPIIASKTLRLLKQDALQEIATDIKPNTYFACKDSTQQVWFVRDKDLFLLDKNNKLKHVSNIPNSTALNSIIAYKDWIVMSTWYDLFLFDVKSYIQHNKILLYKFGINDGLSTYKGGARSLSVDVQSKLIYWACNDYLFQINPELLLQGYSHYSKPIVKNIAVNNFEQADVSLTDSIQLDEYYIRPKYRNINYDITYSSQIGVYKPKLRYRLLGYENKWTITQSTEIKYFNLPPGRYQLEIQLSAYNDNWSASSYSKTTVLQPKWFETLIFKILIFLIVLVMLILIHDFRIRQLKKVLSVRQKISQNLHDDIGSTLSAINMYSQVAKLQPHDGEFFINIEESAQDALGKLDDIIWSTNPKNDKIKNLVERMDGFARPLLQAKNIQFHFNHTSIVDQHKIGESIRQNLFFIFKEAINNVAKYSDCKNCTVTLEIKNKLICCTISDDGKGFDADQPTQRNGILNMQLRAKEMKGSFFIDSIISKGTVIKVRLPIQV